MQDVYKRQDKNSVNGTFLNGRLVTEKTRLHYGDIIYVVGLKIVYLNNLLAKMCIRDR